MRAVTEGLAALTAGELRASHTERSELFIGRWQPSAGGRRVVVRSPATAEPFGSAVLGTAADINRAVAVISVISYDREEEAVAIANDSPYGLSGSVWSADEQRAIAVARRLRTGMVSINGRSQAFGSPLGGFKQSGLGRELGPEGFDAYLEVQSIAIPSRRI